MALQRMGGGPSLLQLGPIASMLGRRPCIREAGRRTSSWLHAGPGRKVALCRHAGNCDHMMEGSTSNPSGTQTADTGTCVRAAARVEYGRCATGRDADETCWLARESITCCATSPAGGLASLGLLAGPDVHLPWSLCHVGLALYCRCRSCTQMPDLSGGVADLLTSSSCAERHRAGCARGLWMQHFACKNYV